MTRAEYVQLLQALGHYRAAVVRKKDGRRFYATCECGYESTTRIDPRDAVGAIEHHREKVLKEYRANGASLPGTVAAHH